MSLSARVCEEWVKFCLISGVACDNPSRVLSYEALHYTLGYLTRPDGGAMDQGVWGDSREGIRKNWGLRLQYSIMPSIIHTGKEKE